MNTDLHKKKNWIQIIRYAKINFRRSARHLWWIYWNCIPHHKSLIKTWKKSINYSHTLVHRGGMCNVFLAGNWSTKWEGEKKGWMYPTIKNSDMWTTFRSLGFIHPQNCADKRTNPRATNIVLRRAELSLHLIYILSPPITYLHTDSRLCLFACLAVQ